MQTGTYELSLRCDNISCHYHGVATFMGTDKTDARGAAKHRGWMLKLNGKCYCPKCAEKMRGKP